MLSFIVLVGNYVITGSNIKVRDSFYLLRKFWKALFLESQHKFLCLKTTSTLLLLLL